MGDDGERMWVGENCVLSCEMRRELLHLSGF